MNARDLLVKLGIGQFNATMVIQYMFIAPATTDPKSAPVMLLVKHLQQKLQALGYPVIVNGYLDRTTASAIQEVVGPGWESVAWGETVRGVLAASADDPRALIAASYSVGSQKPPIVLPPSSAVGDDGIAAKLGVSPGILGALIAVGAYVVYEKYNKKRGR